MTPAAVGRPRPSRPPRVRKGAPPGSAWHRARHTDFAGFLCEVFGPSGPELKGVTELHGPDLPLNPHPCTRGLEPGAQAPPGTPSLESPRADTLAPAGAAGPPSPAQGTRGAAQTGSRWRGRGARSPAAGCFPPAGFQDLPGEAGLRGAAARSGPGRLWAPQPPPGAGGPRTGTLQARASVRPRVRPPPSPRRRRPPAAPRRLSAPRRAAPRAPLPRGPPRAARPPVSALAATSG